jgi:hypothetical protein
MKTIRENFENLPRHVAELHAQPVRRSLGEGGFAESAKLEQASFHSSYFTLHSSTGGLGYGG